jgi:hypothetical protein
MAAVGEALTVAGLEAAAIFSRLGKTPVPCRFFPSAEMVRCGRTGASISGQIGNG